MLLTIFLGLCFILFLITYKYLTANRGVVENLGIPYLKPLTSNQIAVEKPSARDFIDSNGGFIIRKAPVLGRMLL